MRKRLLPLALALCGFALGATPVMAHYDEDEPSKLHDDGAMNSGKETHNHDAQHGTDQGHLPATRLNVDVVGKLSTADGAGRIADVSAKGNYAYLTRFYEPTCDTGGVDIVDMSNPAAPTKVSSISSHNNTFSGEGSQVVTLNTPHFKGDLLVFQNEICPDPSNSGEGIGGITLVDVTDPHRPRKLVEGAGDFEINGKAQTKAHETHSAFMWQDGSKAYVVLVDDEEGADVDILDITNPSRPVKVSETDLSEETQQPLGAVHGDAVFLHDMVVKKIGTKQVMLASYWDGGYVKLDVTDPKNPVYMADTDYPALDPVRLGFGQEISPEGNAHQAEFTRDDKWFIATDEDFDPYRAKATILDGRYAGTDITAVQGSGVPQIDDDTSIKGDTVYVGRACTLDSVPAAPAGGAVAVVERGDCTFTTKAQNVQAKGYTGGIVFNRPQTDGCETLITMLVEADIPMVFVSRTDGFRVLDLSLDGYTCSESGAGTGVSTPVGGAGSDVDISAVFDGWGYVHQYDAKSMAEVDTYALPEGQDAAYGSGFGDLSVHEVATDPDKNLAYLSYYTGGFRVLKYGAGGMAEVGRFIAEGGNNFWGVEVHKHPNGQKYVLASDRDTGLWILRYTGK